MERQDRRRYFRINDLVGLSYQLVEESAAKTQLAEGHNVHISTLRLLQAIDRELADALNHLWQSMPAAANVLGLLNRKVDILCCQLGLDYEGADLKHEETPVNISACGMAFESEEHFETGQVLALHLLLKPANQRLKLTGYVAACERSPAGSEKPFFLRVDFIRLEAQTQEELIQHIVRRQSVLLNAQRQQQS